MTHPTTPGQPNPRPRYSRWLLPDDHIIDTIAIDLTARGVRRVPLTHSERRLAAAVILADGGGITDVARRLHISDDTARTLLTELIGHATPGHRDQERKAA